MKTETHPDYVECRVTCSCGNQFVTRATVPELRVELCAECHPFYTGKQKLVDTGGRVERFEKRYAKAQAPATEADEAEADKKQDRRKKRAADAPRRKPPVATKGGPRPKYERRPGDEGDDDRGKRGKRGGRAERSERGGRGERAERSEKSEAPAEAGEAAGSGDADAPAAESEA